MKTVYLKLKHLIFLILFVGLLLSGLAFLFYNGILRFNNLSYKEFPVQGLDVSHHQGDISWNLIDTKKYKFVFVKATEGGNYIDDKYKQNIKLAKDAGLFVGAYHFFTFKKSGGEQANNYIKCVSLQDIDFPPVVDLEYTGNSNNKSSKAVLKKELSEYLSRLEAHYHQQPILYTTYEFYDYYLKANIDNYPIWIRDIFKYPSRKKVKTWYFWQYSNRGKVEGINGFVDLNVFNGNDQKFREYLNQ